MVSNNNKKNAGNFLSIFKDESFLHKSAIQINILQDLFIYLKDRITQKDRREKRGWASQREPERQGWKWRSFLYWLTLQISSTAKAVKAKIKSQDHMNDRAPTTWIIMFNLPRHIAGRRIKSQDWNGHSHLGCLIQNWWLSSLYHNASS